MTRTRNLTLQHRGIQLAHHDIPRSSTTLSSSCLSNIHEKEYIDFARRNFSTKNQRVCSYTNLQSPFDRDVINQLSAKTDEECNNKGKSDLLMDEESSSSKTPTILPPLDLIRQWYTITNSIHVPNINRKRNRFTSVTDAGKQSSPVAVQLSSSDAIEDLRQIKLECATNMDRLLQHYVQHYIFNSSPTGTAPAQTGEGGRRSSPSSSSLLDLIFKSKHEDGKHETRPFAMVIEAWNQSSSWAPEAGQKAAEVLESWWKIYGGDMENAPTRQDIDVVLETFAKCSSGDYSSYSAETYPAEMAWELFEVLSRQDDPLLLPAIATCSHIVHALSNHAFVRRYAKKQFDTNMESDIAAIRAYFAWKRMMEIVQKQETLNDNELVLIWRAHADILNLSSDSMLKRDDKDTSDGHLHLHEHELALKVGHDSEELLVRLLRMHGMDGRGNEDVTEYLCHAFSSTMVAWTKEQSARINAAIDYRKSGREHNQLDEVWHGAKSVAMLLDIMKEQGLEPRSEHYYSAILAYAKCLHSELLPFDSENRLKEVLPRVRKLFSDLEIDYLDELVNRKYDGLFVTTREKVDASIYQTVIDCFSWNFKRGGHKNDCMEAIKVFERMLDLYEKDLLWIKGGHRPITVSLNRIFKMINEIKPSRQDVEMATDLLERLDSLPFMQGNDSSKPYKPGPDATTYGTYITLMSRSKMKNTHLRVASILDKMENDGIKLGLIHYAPAIKLLVQGGGEYKLRARDLLFKSIQEYNDLPLEEQSKSDFNASILYASMITPRKSSEAISFLNALEKQYDHTMDDRLKPTLILYNAVLHAIAVDGNRAPWKDVKALEIYGQIESMYRNGDADMIPNKQCSTSMMEVLAKSQLDDSHDIAKGILEDMDEHYLRTECSDVKPDFRLFLAYMKVLASSNEVSKAKQTWSILMEVEERFQKEGDISLKPTVAALNVILNACAYTTKFDEKEEALGIVEEVQKISSGDGGYTPDSVFYNNTIKAYGFLLKDASQKKQREKGISVVFERCCRKGLLDQRILRSIERFYPELYNKLNVSSKWSRNVKTIFRAGSKTPKKTKLSSSIQ